MRKGGGEDMNDSTFGQRRAIFNMRSALGEDVRGIKFLSFDQASKEIDQLKKRIAKDGFPEKEETTERYQPDFDGRR